ncbi:MAG: PEP-CTERM sorting domain-containing protein [Spirulina sp. SIO3F2]|nr:PEP-CTERM sorting domain-containing protein [Spirulina sp. SIO3F2]
MKLFAKLGLIGLVSGAAIATAVTPSYAQGFATRTEVYDPGTGNIADYRRDVTNALGTPQADRTRDFLSLGMGGSAIFSFASAENVDGYFSGSVTVWETTWGNKSRQSQYDERIEVFVGNNLNDVENWLSIGEIWNIRDGAFDTNQSDGSAGSGATLDIGNDDLYKYVRVVDLSQKRADGFDVNAIAVNPANAPAEAVPEPATIIGGLLALGGGALAKKCRNR